MAVSFFEIKCYVQLYLLVLHFSLLLKKSFSFQFQQHVEIDHQMFQELISIMNPIYEYFTGSSWSVFLLFIVLSMLIQGHFLISLISKAGWEAVLVNPFTLNILTKIHINTSVCLPYISYKFCCENLVLDQVIFPLLTDNVFPILMPWLSHIVLILYGEILSWSLQDSNQFSINCNPKNLFTQNLRVGTFRVA